MQIICLNCLNPKCRRSTTSSIRTLTGTWLSWLRKKNLNWLVKIRFYFISFLQLVIISIARNSIKKIKKKATYSKVIVFLLNKLMFLMWSSFHPFFLCVFVHREEKKRKRNLLCLSSSSSSSAQSAEFSFFLLLFRVLLKKYFGFIFAFLNVKTNKQKVKSKSNGFIFILFE